MPGDILTGLSFGKSEAKPLKTFLKNKAQEFHTKNLAKTYVVVEDESPSRVWGYATLMCSSIDLGKNHRIDDCEAAGAYRNFPAVKIARLALHSDIQGRGIGRSLVDWSISVAKEGIMPHVGCRFLVVDSKKSAVGFYEKVGFTFLNTEKNRKKTDPVLFLDIHRLGKVVK